MDIKKYTDDSGIFDSRIIASSEIPFSEHVVKYCEMNSCGMYGKLWTCPPGVGNLRDNEEKIKSYPNALVISFRSDIEDCFDFEGMSQAGKNAKKQFSHIVETIKNDGEDILPLGCEGCGLCEKCTYPDAPCRFPEKAIPSVEAMGIDVVSLTKNIGMKYNNGKNTVTYFCIILYR